MFQNLKIKRVLNAEVKELWHPARIHFRILNRILREYVGSPPSVSNAELKNTNLLICVSPSLRSHVGRHVY